MTFKLLYATRLVVCLTAGFALSSPALAIQNIGFPDDETVGLAADELANFSAGQQALLDALAAVVKFDGVDGESKRVNAALQSVQSNASALEAIAVKAGQKDIANFMSTIRTWSVSGGADDRPRELTLKISDAVRSLKAVKE